MVAPTGVGAGVGSRARIPGGHEKKYAARGWAVFPTEKSTNCSSKHTQAEVGSSGPSRESRRPSRGSSRGSAQGPQFFFPPKNQTKTQLIAPTKMGGRRALQTGHGVKGVGEGVIKSSISIGASPGSRAVPGPEIWNFKKV